METKCGRTECEREPAELRASDAGGLSGDYQSDVSRASPRGPEP